MGEKMGILYHKVRLMQPYVFKICLVQGKSTLELCDWNIPQQDPWWAHCIGALNASKATTYLEYFAIADGQVDSFLANDAVRN